MSSFESSDKINDLCARLSSDELEDIADSSCTRGYDSDGSTIFECFQNGFELARQAGSDKVFKVRGENAIYFFIGTEESICAELKEVLGE